MKTYLLVFAALAAAGMSPGALAAPPFVRPPLVNSRGVINQRNLAPTVKITSPLDGDFIAPGDSRVRDGDPNGTGFAIVAEIVTHDQTTVSVDEDVNIRHVADLGGVNPQFPGLFVFIDADLITPNGTIIPAATMVFR